LKQRTRKTAFVGSLIRILRALF